MLFLFRIGSRPVLLIISFILMIFFSACSDGSETELAVFNALDEGLSNSSMTINRATETVMWELKEKTKDPASATKANIWYPKALVAQQKSQDVISYLEKLKLTLKKESGFDESKNSFNGRDKTSVARVLKEMGKGTDLYDSLMKFKEDVFAIDQQIKQVFESNIILTSKSFEVLDKARVKFTEVFFKNISLTGALAVLSNFQNSIKIYENRIIQFCNSKVGITHDYYTIYSAIIGQNSSYVKGGEMIEITAGVGVFSKSAKPTISINGKYVDIGESATAIYKFKSPKKAGKYVVPVKIDFIDRDGIKQLITKNIEYTVAKQ